jgi:hypothetical protein
MARATPNPSRIAPSSSPLRRASTRVSSQKSQAACEYGGSGVLLASLRLHAAQVWGWHATMGARVGIPSLLNKTTKISNRT